MDELGKWLLHWLLGRVENVAMSYAMGCLIPIVVQCPRVTEDFEEEQWTLKLSSVCRLNLWRHQDMHYLAPASTVDPIAGGMKKLMLQLYSKDMQVGPEGHCNFHPG